MEVTSETHQGGRRHRLRSSCDACGSAKVKCDRSQGICSRCADFGLVCHYGISKRLGRQKRKPTQPSSFTTEGCYEDQVPSTCTHGDTSRIEGDDDNEIASPSIGADTPFDQNGNLHCSTDSASKSHWSNSNVSTAHNSFPDISSNSQDWADLEKFFEVEQGKLFTEAFPTYNAGENPIGHSLTRIHTTNGNIDTSIVQTHVQGASEVLSSLACTNSGPITGEAAGSGTLDADASLDQILRLNRMAVERLDHLISSSGTIPPELALLYCASIIRILNWYRHAATRTSNTVKNTTVAIMGSQAQGSGDASSNHYGTSNLLPATSYVDAAAATTTTMTVGGFDVEDLHVQTALQMQLLTGEIKKLGRLIDHFVASHQPSAQHHSGFPSLNGVDVLYYGLDSWLRNEYKRVFEIAKTTLFDLNN